MPCKMNKVPVHLWAALCNHCCILVLASVFAWCMNKVVIVARQDTTIATQFNEDWKVVPIVDVQIVQGDCVNADDVFNRVWRGTVKGCEVAEGTYTHLLTEEEYEKFIEDKKHEFSGKDEGEKKRKARNKYPCREIAPLPWMDQTRFFGKSICATRGGKPFKDATRP